MASVAGAGLSRRDRRIGLTFHNIARFRQCYFDQIVGPLGLTHAQVFVLNHLLREDGQSQVELATRLDLGTVAVSGLVDRLEANHWVQRRPDGKDRRTKRVWLLPKVQDTIGEIYSAISRLNKLTLAGLSASEADQLISLLVRVEKNLLHER